MKTGLIRLICIVRLVLLESVVYYMGYWGKTEIAGIDAGMVKWL